MRPCAFDKDPQERVLSLGYAEFIWYCVFMPDLTFGLPFTGWGFLLTFSERSSALDLKWTITQGIWTCMRCTLQAVAPTLTRLSTSQLPQATKPYGPRLLGCYNRDENWLYAGGHCWSCILTHIFTIDSDSSTGIPDTNVGFFRYTGTDGCGSDSNRTWLAWRIVYA